MATRKTRILRADQIFDQFPLGDYPSSIQDKLKLDLIELRLKLAATVEKVMAEEAGDLLSHMQQLLAELRIDIEHLNDVVQ